MRLLEFSKAFAGDDFPNFDLAGFGGGGKHVSIATDCSAQDSIIVHHELHFVTFVGGFVVRLVDTAGDDAIPALPPETSNLCTTCPCRGSTPERKHEWRFANYEKQ